MKEVIALCVTVSLIAITITLGVQKQLDWNFSSALMLIAILLGLVIVNYDVVSKLKMGGLEVETIRTIEQVKSDALEEMKTQGETLKTLVRQGNEIATRLEEQQSRVETLLTSAQAQEERLLFSELKMRATAGSRKAYEELVARTRIASGDERAELERVVRSVAFQFGADKLYVPRPIEYEDANKKVVQLKDVPVDRIIQDWSPESGFSHKQVLDTLQVKNDKNAIPFVLEKLKVEQDLFDCAAAISCLSKLTGVRSGVIDYDFWLSGAYEKELSSETKE